MIGEIWTIGLFVTDAIIGGMLMDVRIPEMRERSLEDLNEKDMAVAPACSYARQAIAASAE